MFSSIKRLYDWMGTRVYSPYASPILGFLFFIEAIFFLPTDPMLILYCIHRQSKALLYATVATFSSVAGGITAYILGSFLWHHFGEQIITNSFVNYIVTPELFTYLSEQYRLHALWALLIAGFTPIPYKAATLTAGFCNISLFPFIIGSLIGRGARFFLLASIVIVCGDRIKKSLDKYFNIIIALMTLIIVLTIWWLKKGIV